MALEADLSDNVTRISALETATIISNSSTITTGFTKGDIIYASADNVLNKLAVGGTDGHVLKVTSATNKTLGWAAETGGGGGGGGSTPWVTNGNKIHYSMFNSEVKELVESVYSLSEEEVLLRMQEAI